MAYIFDTKNATWDIENHIAIPTVKFIKDNTGIDLNIFSDSFPGTVEGKIRMLSIDAKNELFFNKAPRCQNVLSYLMAYDKDYSKNWLNFATSYINDTFTNMEQVSSRTNKRRKLIDFYDFTIGFYSEVEESTLEW